MIQTSSNIKYTSFCVFRPITTQPLNSLKKERTLMINLNKQFYFVKRLKNIPKNLLKRILVYLDFLNEDDKEFVFFSDYVSKKTKEFIKFVIDIFINGAIVYSVFFLFSIKNPLSQMFAIGLAIYIVFELIKKVKKK